MYEGGKGQEKCVLINSGGGIQERKVGKNLPSVVKLNISSTRRHSNTSKGQKPQNDHQISAGRL